MSIPADIAAALAQFPEAEFPARDICRRFAAVRPEHVRHALKELAEKGKVQRRMRFGVYCYRVAA